MPHYKVRFVNGHDVTIEADEEPVTKKTTPANASDCWTFKRGSKTVAQFQFSQVMGWWELREG